MAMKLRTIIPGHHHGAILALILVASFVLKLNHLGHKSLKPLDEAFHAIVAANFLKHPLTPTLNDVQYIPCDISNWQNTHIWLHKPPMAMWQIALSYAIFGVNTFALRLPSAILATAAVWLTYLIGRELLDSTAALIAAALQAFNPAIVSLTHGYLFSDHVDISLLFWVETSVYFLVRAIRSSRRLDLILCGVAQGLAFLSKTYPALIVTGLAIVAWIPLRVPISGRGVLILLGATFATVVPWMAWAAIRWPELFFYEHAQILQHLHQDIEGWGAPWDRLVFDFLIRAHHVYYPAVLTAVILMTIYACRRGSAGCWMVLAWAMGVLLPNLAAVSKTLSATLTGWPAMWLALGWMIAAAIRGQGLALGAWLVSMLLALLIRPDNIPQAGKGYPDVPGLAVIMRQHLWVVWHVAAALTGGLVLMRLQKARTILVGIASAAMLLLALRWWGGVDGYAYFAWRITAAAKDTPNFQAIGRFARTLPPQAVFLVDEQSKLENKLIQFTADRTCYGVPNLQWEPMARGVVDSGGLPYLVTNRPMDLPVVFTDTQEQRTVYACSELAKAAAEQRREVLLP